MPKASRATRGESADLGQVGFDVPLVAHDMMLRFMGVDFSLVPGWEAGAASSVGGVLRPQIGVQSANKESGKGMALMKGGNTDWECESRSSSPSTTCGRLFRERGM